MRRAALAIVSTVAGLVLLLGFKTHGTGAAGGATVAQAPATTGTTSSGSPSKNPPSTAPSAAPTGAASPSKPSSTQTVSGQTYDTQYGPVQVRITVTNGRLTDVAALQLPQGNGRDIEIDNYAVPQLRNEALGAQSAHIDMVSGATYTSDGYIKSLQSALDQVHA